jgi:hypothetical protein
MADTTATPRKTRKPQGPRTPKPIFAVVTYEDENGNPVVLNKSNIKIVLERDAAKLLDLVTGEGMGPAAVVRVELPQTTPRKQAEAGTAPAT